MNMGSFSDRMEQLRRIKLPQVKPMLIGGIAFVVVLMVMVIVSTKTPTKKTTVHKVNLLPSEAMPRSRPSLDYEFIKFDSIKIPNFSPATQPITSAPTIEPVPFQQPIESPRQSSGSSQKSTINAPGKMETDGTGQIFSLEPKTISQNPNMIVTNNLADAGISSGSGPAVFTGMQASLIKVILPNRTPVANGSLVEARVLRDSRWGNIFIPKRTKLIGIASLMNLRVHVDFQEIYINNTSRSCRGRAYDLKRLQGLAYSPVSSEAKRVLLEELRDAVAGVPVLGRVANRAAYSANYYDQEASVLDEGLEFYVLIESIY